MDGIDGHRPAALDRPAVVERYVMALVRAQRDYHQAVDLGRASKDPIIQSLITHTSIKDPQQWAGIALAPMNPEAPFDLRLVDAFQDFLLEAGVQSQKIDVNTAIDLSWYQRAPQQLGPPR